MFLDYLGQWFTNFYIIIIGELIQTQFSEPYTTDCDSVGQDWNMNLLLLHTHYTYAHGY